MVFLKFNRDYSSYAKVATPMYDGGWELGTMNQPPIAWMQSASDHGWLEAFGELTLTLKPTCTYLPAISFCEILLTTHQFNLVTTEVL